MSALPSACFSIGTRAGHDQILSPYRIQRRERQDERAIARLV
jgi:hypothetical protein